MLELLISFIVAALPACPTEDSINCVWDADSRGNGVGQSFIHLEW